MLMREEEWQAAKQESLATLAFLSEGRVVLESCRMRSDSTYIWLEYEGKLSIPRFSPSRGLKESFLTPL